MQQRDELCETLLLRHTVLRRNGQIDFIDSRGLAELRQRLCSLRRLQDSGTLPYP